MYRTDEIAPHVYRISLFIPEIQLQFNHFLVNDDEPLLYHAGLKQTFSILHEAVSKIIEPASLKWIGFSHFEADECGALNDWLLVAPGAQAVCGEVGAMVNMADYAIRPARAMKNGEVLETGERQYRFIRTPHLPHGWDAGVLFEQTDRTLFCSDLLHQNGDVVALTDQDILERHRSSILSYEAGPLMSYTPYNHTTQKILFDLAGLKPRTLATMHGSSFFGDCSQVLKNLDEVMQQIWGKH